MPDAPVGRLISKQASAVQVQLGNGKFLKGTANMHPYYFSFQTFGKCGEFKRKRTCNKARGCSWRGNTCNLSGSAPPFQTAEVSFNDIALVVLDEDQPDVKKVTLSDSGDATESCRGRGRRRCRQRLSAARRSAVIGRGKHLPEDGGLLFAQNPKVEIGEKTYPTFWDAF